MKASKIDVDFGKIIFKVGVGGVKHLKSCFNEEYGFPSFMVTWDNGEMEYFEGHPYSAIKLKN